MRIWADNPEENELHPPVQHYSGVGLARIYAACIGEVDGIRLLSPELLERARTPMTDDVPSPPEFAAITTMPPRFGLGFQLPRAEIDAMLGAGSFGHTGAGGRLSFAILS